ncbi:MAG: hypothetical protein JXD22_14920 [Sedimentisphaerales bacterium]|nr:hypothetical protein [Sedimentisphaerales bacterium]
MSSKLAKRLLIASCVIVIVSVGFMVFSTPNAGAANLDVYVKCQACGEAKTYSSKDFAELARKQLNELKSSDPDLFDEIKDEFAIVSERYGLPPESVPTLSDAEIEKRLISSWGSKEKDIPIKCEKCGEYECFRALKCKKCGEIFDIKKPQDKLIKTCPKCRGG